MNIKCPSCGHIANVDEFFRWLPDEKGHPTVEQMICPDCLCSNIPYRGDYPMRDEKGRFVKYPEFAHFDDFIEVVA